MGPFSGFYCPIFKELPCIVYFARTAKTICGGILTGFHTICYGLHAICNGVGETFPGAFPPVLAIMRA